MASGVEDSSKTVIHVDDIGFREALSSQQQTWCRVPRKKILRSIESLPCRVATMLLILLDLILVVLDLIDHQTAYDYISLSIVIVFVVEVGLRIFALGPQKFFTNWVMTLDFAVIILTFIVTIVLLSIQTLNDAARLGKLVILLRLIRLPRLIVLLRVFLTERKQLTRATRHVVSQNKKRFQDDGFDLDLCYITDRVIAMSFPSSGLMAMYRNPIREVAKFLDLKHPGGYKVYNLCSERTYDTTHFHGRVERYLIDDHNVPRLSDMVKFANSVRQWMSGDSGRVIAVHCKGGKGRTGTMICTYMVDAGIYENAKECLEYFGLKRTDYLEGIKFQGVETPSQNRYVGFFEIIKRQFNYEMPPNVTLRVCKIILHSITGIGNGDGSDFWFQVFEGGRQVLEADLGIRKNCVVENEGEDVTVTITCPPAVTNDVKFRFFSRNKSVPAAYEHCAFFFWIYTYFIEDYRIQLHRSELDNPHKTKTWRVWHEKFSVEVQFEPVNAA